MVHPAELALRPLMWFVVLFDYTGRPGFAVWRVSRDGTHVSCKRMSDGRWSNGVPTDPDDVTWNADVQGFALTQSQVGQLRVLDALAPDQSLPLVQQWGNEERTAR